MNNRLKDKKIILGITGGIAAYKSCELIRLFKKNGADVRVIMTRAAKEFITPLTLRTLSGNTVYNKLFEQDLELDLKHISLARWADCILIAPATANIMAKLAYGFADDLLSTVCLAATAPIAIAPAMNQAMWHNTTTQENVNRLKQKNIRLFGPDAGVQACGEIGNGRMPEPKSLLEMTATLFTQQHLYPQRVDFPRGAKERAAGTYAGYVRTASDAGNKVENSIAKGIKGKKVVITAGPTIEPIDPVRFISNHSSGKMGYAIAKAAADYGADVQLISGPTALSVPDHVTKISVKTANEMFNAVMSQIDHCDIFIGVAAVSDYRVEKPATQKIKKHRDTLELSLIKNPDILANVAALKSPPFTVGFAAETNELLENGKKKLQAKNLGMICCNQVGNDKGFNQQKNALTVLTKTGQSFELAEKDKSALAYELMDIILNEYLTNLPR